MERVCIFFGVSQVWLELRNSIFKNLEFTMSLDQVIPPEVINDSFYFSLKEIAKRSDLKTFL